MKNQNFLNKRRYYNDQDDANQDDKLFREVVDGHTLSIQYALLFVFRTTRRGFLKDNTSILNKIGVFTKEVVTVSKYSKDNSPIFEKTVR